MYFFFTICIMNVCKSSEISSVSMYWTCKVLFWCAEDTDVDNDRLSQLSCFLY